MLRKQIIAKDRINYIYRSGFIFPAAPRVRISMPVFSVDMAAQCAECDHLSWCVCLSLCNVCPVMMNLFAVLINDASV